MKTLIIKGGTCITPETVIEQGTVIVRGGIIACVDAMGASEIPSDAEIIDASGLCVCPGFIDIQMNGAAGVDVLDATEEALSVIAHFGILHGTTSFLPTLVSAPLEKMLTVFEQVRRLQSIRSPGSRIIGVHLEGPYISRTQLGAHDPRHVRVPTAKEADVLLANADVIRIITAAPEVEGVVKLCGELTEMGTVASIGHSNATYEQVMAAVDSGFSMVTHIYSVMSSMMRIGPRKVAGVLEAALLLDKLTVGVIGDGLHVPEPFLRLVIRMKGAGKIILATDAIRATGLPDGEYAIGGQEDHHLVVVENGIAMTADRKLYAGSTTTMDACVRNAVSLGGISLKDAVAMATINPAKLLHMEDRLGALEPGRKGDIVILDRELKPVCTIINGNVVFQRENVTSSNQNLIR